MMELWIFLVEGQKSFSTPKKMYDDFPTRVLKYSIDK